MKKILNVSVIILALMLTTFCSKDKKNTIIENPLKATIESENIVDTFYAIIGTGINYEFGNKFYASRDGRITKLGCKMPQNGSYRVSLWNFATTNLITATTITTTDSTSFFYNNISPVSITTGNRYVISINNTDAGIAKRYYIYFKKPTISDAIYPFTKGSITFEDFQTTVSISPTYPSTINPSYQTILAGVPDFQFEYDD